MDLSSKIKLINDIKLVLEYIQRTPTFEMVDEIDTYDHMGAVITDAMLQSGIKYSTVVEPRVNEILKRFPNAKSTSEFLKILEEFGVENILNFKGDKPKRVLALTQFLVEEQLETTKELLLWLKQSDNVERLKEIRGIGDKTVDYIKILVGLQTNAIDRHLLNFIKDAGVLVKDYKEAHHIIEKTASILDIESSIFDHSIWTFMSEQK